jgi:hypothetical protein
MLNMTRTTYSIDMGERSGHHFVSDIVVKDGQVIDSSPPARGFIGSSLAEAKQRCKANGWKITKHVPMTLKEAIKRVEALND